MGVGKWLLTDIWSAEARDALNIIQGPGQASQQRIILTQDVNSIEVEKPSVQVIELPPSVERKI